MSEKKKDNILDLINDNCVNYGNKIKKKCKIIINETGNHIILFDLCYACRKKAEKIQKIKDKILDLEFELFKLTGQVT